MVYTKEFNKFFDSFDTGDRSQEEIELIKTDMFSSWEIQQEKIDKLHSDIIFLTRAISRMCPRRTRCDSSISLCLICVKETFK